MHILLVEDDRSHAKVIRHVLERHGHDVCLAITAAEGKTKLAQRHFDLILVDYVLPDATGMSLLESHDGRPPKTPTIFLTATDSAEVCLTAIRAGAADYIVKSTDYLRNLPERIASVIHPSEAASRHSQPRRAVSQNVAFAHPALDSMLGSSPEMVQLKRSTLRAAGSDLPILIEGPTGAGKELVARAVHELGKRAGKPFIAVNCAALPTALFESELFGHVKGAFTSAVGTRRGLVLGAHEGTLFLDEVGELALESQAKLLRLLQNLEFRPVGSDTQRRADVRVVAATNRPLHGAGAQRPFRADLYYRLAVVHIAVPPLASRSGDLRLLTCAMVRSFAPRLEMATPEIAEEALKQIEHYSWPGNVRELENVVKRTLAEQDGPVINSFLMTAADAASISEERAALADLLQKSGGNLSQIARALGVSRPTLYKHLQRHGLVPDTFRSTVLGRELRSRGSGPPPAKM